MQSKELVNPSHPLAVALRQIIIDRNQMCALTRQSIQVQWHGCDQGFAFAGSHFCNFTFMKDDCAHKLHIIRHHIPFDFLPAHQPLLS